MSLASSRYTHSYTFCNILFHDDPGFPLTVYEDYIREHKYGLATQTFGPWMIDQLKIFAVTLVLAGLLAMALFGVVRKFRAPGGSGARLPRSAF